MQTAFGLGVYTGKTSCESDSLLDLGLRYRPKDMAELNV